MKIWLIIVAFALLGAFEGGLLVHAQAESPPLRCQWRLVVAVPDAGKTLVAFNGTTVVPAGYPEGFSSSGIAASAGPIRLELRHPLLGVQTTTVELAPKVMNTLVVHVVEEEQGNPGRAEEQKQRRLAVSNLSSRLEGEEGAEILLASFCGDSDHLRVELVGLVDSSQAASEEPGAAASTARKLALTLRGGEQKLVAFQGQEITEIAAGEQRIEVARDPDQPPPVVVFYHRVDGRVKVVGAF